MTHSVASIFVLAFAAGVAGAQTAPAQSPAPAAAATVTATTAPNDVKAVYRVYRNGFPIGKTEEHFVRDGNRYRIVSETAPDGALSLFLRDKLTVTSEGIVNGNGLRPARFENVRQSNDSKSVRAAFDWERKIMASEHGGKIERVPLLPGTQDRLSSMYQFMLNMPRQSEVTLIMSNGRKIEHYHFRKEGEPQIKTQAGEFKTVHYARDAKPDEDEAEIWLATEQHFLPVRVLFKDRKGATSEQMLVSLTTK
jgi:hypothetical protein